MIGHGHQRATYVAASVLALNLIFAGAARAESLETVAIAQPAFSVTFVQNGEEVAYPTRAATVAAFLAEHQIAVEPDDYLSVPVDSALVDGMRIEYRPSVLSTIFIGEDRRDVRSSVATIRQLLVTQGVAVGPNDEVTPSLEAPLLPNTVVRIVRVKVWTAKVMQPIAIPLEQRADAHIARGRTKTLSEGLAGKREIVYRLVQRNGERAQRSLVASRVLQKPHPKIVAVGIAERRTFVEYAAEHLNDALNIAGTALRMVATAYTGDCYGCMGITAFGLRPGHGVVAVDPRYIRLGTKLYVPGYGPAIAGDTGGAIKGRRIDLGFNSLAQAINFGRREVTVYVLR